jgi:membrane-associated protease RseP (regulator of RpoE activity)
VTRRLARLIVEHFAERTSSWRVPAVFFLLTVASTLWVGGYQGLGYWAPELLSIEAPAVSGLARVSRHVLYGAPFSFTILLIIFSHEMGHYVAARRHRVDTTLPFFIPFPLSLIGTFGAFILIKSRFPNRRALLDVGLAGPFAGLLVTIPALLIGIETSRPGPAGSSETSISFGEPLLFQWLSHWIWPGISDGEVLWISPIGLAAWFGLLLTALNLLPIGQLDGGHASYALLGSRAHRLSAIAFFLFLPMAYFGPSWLFWALLLYGLGIRRPHPPTLADAIEPPWSRRVMGVLALIVFALSFTPEPIEFNWADVFLPIRDWLSSR